MSCGTLCNCKTHADAVLSDAVSFVCEISGRGIYRHKPEGMRLATMIDFINPDGSLKVGQPFILGIEQAKTYWYVHRIKADDDRRELQEFIDSGLYWVKDTKKK